MGIRRDRQKETRKKTRKETRRETRKEKADRINTLVRVGCLILLLVMTRVCVLAEELPAADAEPEAEPEKTEIRIILRPEKTEGEPDPDLSEEIRMQIGTQVGDDPDLVDRLCACVGWAYVYNEKVQPPGEARAPGESDIFLSFEEDSEYTFSGWMLPEEEPASEGEVLFGEEEPGPEAEYFCEEEPGSEREYFCEEEPEPEAEYFCEEEPVSGDEVFFGEEEPGPEAEYFCEEEPGPEAEYFFEEEPGPETEYFCEEEPGPEGEYFCEGEPGPETEYFCEGETEDDTKAEDDLRSFLTTHPREAEPAEEKETGPDEESGEGPEGEALPEPPAEPGEELSAEYAEPGEELSAEYAEPGEELSAEYAEPGEETAGEQTEFYIEEEAEEDEFYISESREDVTCEEEAGTEKEVYMDDTADEKNTAVRSYETAYAVPQELTAGVAELLRDGDTETEVRMEEAGGSEAQEAEVQTQVQLLRTGSGNKEEDLTEMYREAMAGTDPGQLDWNTLLAPLPENDGTYVLRTTETDRAGKENVKETMFSINRFGSVYTYNDAIQTLRGNTVKSVDRPLVISEYNPDTVKEDSRKVSLSLDGRPVSKVQYTVSNAGKDEDGSRIVSENAQNRRKWNRYDYVIAADNFKEDGVYSLTVSSRDSAGNTSEMHRYNGGGISFTVDGSPPELQAIQGLEKAVVTGRKANVKVTAFDTVGLARLSAFVDGKCMAAVDTFSDRHRAELAFSLNQGPAQRVRIVAEDAAGNILDTDEKTAEKEYRFRPDFPFFRQITVTPPPVSETPEPRGPAAVLMLLLIGCTAASAGMLRHIFRREKRNPARLLREADAD